MANDTLESVAARVDNLEGQVKEIFERLNDRESSPAVLAAKLNSMLVTLGEVKQAIGELKSRPARWWEAIVGAGIASATGAVIGLLFTHMH